MPFNHAMRQKHWASALVQLGGLEPPTSCSTDRRSNQLSYNCILGAARKRGANRAETRCNAALWQGFGKAGRRPVVVAAKPREVHMTKSPGWPPGLFFGTAERTDQAA